MAPGIPAPIPIRRPSILSKLAPGGRNSEAQEVTLPNGSKISSSYKALPAFMEILIQSMALADNNGNSQLGYA